MGRSFLTSTWIAVGLSCVSVGVSLGREGDIKSWPSISACPKTASSSETASASTARLTTNRAQTTHARHMQQMVTHIWSGSSTSSSTSRVETGRHRPPPRPRRPHLTPSIDGAARQARGRELVRVTAMILSEMQHVDLATPPHTIHSHSTRLPRPPLGLTDDYTDLARRIATWRLRRKAGRRVAGRRVLAGHHAGVGRYRRHSRARRHGRHPR